jgi:hypothetical protein
MSWIAAGIAGAASLAGGVMGAQGAMKAGKAGYKAGQIEYHQELERSHYEAKVLQRQMLEQMHMQMAQAGGAGVAAGVGSPMLVAMNTLNDLQEDQAQIYRTGAKNAHKFWMAGADKFTAAQYQATGSLLSGISGAASSYAVGKKG